MDEVVGDDFDEVIDLDGVAEVIDLDGIAQVTDWDQVSGIWLTYHKKTKLSLHK